MTSKILQAAMGAKYGSTFDVAELQKRLHANKKAGRKSSYRKKKSFAPSGLGFSGSCPRYWYYAFNGAIFADTADPKGRSAMDTGTDRHIRIQKNYSETPGIESVIELEVNHDDPPIRGFVDVLVTMDGHKAVGDIKTVKRDKYAMIEARMKPVKEHVLQVLIYMYILDIHDGFIHYENKDDHDEMFFPIAMTPRVAEYVELVLDWMRAVHTNALEGQMPTRGFSKKSMPCHYCPVAKQCWQTDRDIDGLITIENLKTVDV